MADLKNNRWLATDHEFATRVEIGDVSGFFAKRLTIEPGTRAMILELGASVGEVPPGEYSLQAFSEFLKAKLWSQKNITAILVREGAVPLDLDCQGLATREFLEVDVNVRIAIRISDVALFQKNLLASKPALTLDDLKAITLPIVRQALWETVKGRSIKELTSQDARQDLQACIERALGASLKRNGLEFSQIQTLSIFHPEYDEQQRRVGGLFLQREAFGHDQAAAELAADQLLAKIQQDEKTNDLEILAQQVAADRMEGDLAVRIRRIGLRKQIREAVRAGQFDRLQSEAEVEKFLLQRDKERLLRADEMATLKSMLLDQSQDRANARSQILKKLAIEQAAELESIRVDLDFAQQMRTRRHEIELSELNDTEEARQWKKGLEREIQAAEHRRTLEKKRVEDERIEATKSANEGRENEWQKLQHDQRTNRVKGEIDIASAEVRQRVGLIEIETKKSREDAEFAMEQRRKEWELQINKNIALDQHERLRLVQELNNAAFKFQQDMLTAAKQAEAELQVMKEDSVSRREIARINALKGLDDLAIMAVAPTEATPHIADVIKTKATQATAVEIAKAQATAAQLNDARIEELRSKMSDRERQLYDLRVADLQLSTQGTNAIMQQAVQGQNNNFDRFITGMENITKNLAPQAPQSPTVVVAGSTGMATSPAGNSGDGSRRTLVCTQCRAENSESDRFCRQCGKAL